MIREGELVLILNPKKGDSFIIRIQKGQTQGTHFGQINHSELMEHDFGDGVRTPKGEVYYLLRPTLGEYTRRIKRRTQIVFPKEAGFIIEHLNIYPGCTVVECGTGSGSLCCTFAHFVGDTGRVCTYDRREEFSALARKNAERWGVAHRIEFNVRSLEEGFKERNADAVFLDVPDPWEYIGKAYEALAPGNNLGILVPTTNQISETLRAVKEFCFEDVQVLEIMLRRYKTEPNRIRPEDTMIGHTGYLIFAAKTTPLPELPEEAVSEDAAADAVPQDAETEPGGACPESDGAEEMPGPDESTGGGLSGDVSAEAQDAEAESGGASPEPGGACSEPDGAEISNGGVCPESDGAEEMPGTGESTGRDLSGDVSAEAQDAETEPDGGACQEPGGASPESDGAEESQKGGSGAECADVHGADCSDVRGE